MAVQIPLRRKYRIYHGALKRGAPIGMGDSGKHKRKKLPEKAKRALAPQPLVTLHIDSQGHKSWVKTYG